LATPISAIVGSSIPEATSIFSISFSRFSAIGWRRPRGVRSLKKTFGIAVMTWKCLECGRRLRKRRTRVECVQ
jgi:hypothetical protein